jgi:O-antigen polysaccharide polymerase Wzy
VAINQNIILYQCIFLLAIVFYTFRSCSKKDGRPAFDDPAVLWLIVLFLYAAAPALVYYLNKGIYSSWLHGRLYSLQPDTSETISLMHIALGYALGLTVVYLPLRRTIPQYVFSKSKYITLPKVLGAISIIVFTKLLILTISYSGLVRRPESYVDSYKVILEAPLIIRQILKVLMGTNKIAFFVIIIAIMQRYPASKKWLILLVLYNFIIFDPDGGRAGLATTIFASIICWHNLVKPIKTKTWIIVGSLGLVAFTILGSIRGTQNISKEKLILTNFEGLGEMESIWANSVEMLQNKKSAISPPLTVRFEEFWEFVPSQLLPFEKKSLSNWYVSKFYPDFHLLGGGWAFGCIAQAALGGGIIEAFIRGMVLGILLILLMKWSRSYNSPWWSFLVYLHTLTFLFFSIRDTSFVQVSTLLQSVLPSIFLIWIASSIFVKKEKLMSNTY